MTGTGFLSSLILEWEGIRIQMTLVMFLTCDAGLLLFFFVNVYATNVIDEVIKHGSIFAMTHVASASCRVRACANA